MSWLKSRGSALLCLVVALALYFWVVPAHTEDMGGGTISPQFMPRLMALVMGLGALLALFERSAADSVDWRDLTGGLKYLALALLGGLAVRVLGLLLTAPVLAVAVLLLAGERRPLWLGAGAIGVPAVLWLIFDLLLQRPLP